MSRRKEWHCEEEEGAPAEGASTARVPERRKERTERNRNVHRIERDKEKRKDREDRGSTRKTQQAQQDNKHTRKSKSPRRPPALCRMPLAALPLPSGLQSPQQGHPQQHYSPGPRPRSQTEQREQEFGLLSTHVLTFAYVIALYITPRIEN